MPGWRMLPQPQHLLCDGRAGGCKPAWSVHSSPKWPTLRKQSAQRAASPCKNMRVCARTCGRVCVRRRKGVRLAVYCCGPSPPLRSNVRMASSGGNRPSAITIHNTALIPGRTRSELFHRAPKGSRPEQLAAMTWTVKNMPQVSTPQQLCRQRKANNP